MIRTGLFLGLAALLAAGQPFSYAATPQAKPKGAKAPASAASKGTPRLPSVAREPYLGAIAVDAATGKVLFEDRADAKGYPASVLKLMDLLILLEKIQQGQLSLQDKVTVSAKASKTGGSQVWLKEKEVFSLEDLLYALMVQSANDAAVALAEKAAGSTEAFVDLMNKRARELGMASTEFQSVHGLPPGQGQRPDTTTARDFAVLCREVLKHPDTLRFSSAREHPFRPEAGAKALVMRNHNHLLGEIEGCDGFKTGYFTAAGYSVALTASRNGQRVITVVLGSANRKVRDAKAKEILTKALVGLPAATPPPATPPSR